MDWDNIIMYGLIGLAVSLSLSYMNKGTNQSVGRNAEGFVELRMNKFYQILELFKLKFKTLNALFFKNSFEQISTPYSL